jgi:ketosteroid isomerase-like protein
MRTDQPTSDSSNDSATVIGEYFAPLAAGDFARVGELVHPDIRWHQPGANQFSGTLHGRDAVFAMIGRMGEPTGSTFAVAPRGPLLVNGDLVAVDVRFSGQRETQHLDMDSVDLHRDELAAARQSRTSPIATE